ncbi:S-adenosyl-L-methionine-dependent methyltransferase [Basidiobolus meristosporus CBS 931.73]|uniref:S-adenosyl-L-methionine-dependent methyltransferase n=1 Tax=Basidiobolus meristosporus CBS 931.73 TaxID=1314790 RepID=A0A1Y1XVP9_9FUNG|nr:S-adenosyl-L-methionine-dependent methyltransferase [Basidiobolus meristosporus CBS 931.73]|eukprot:ORX89364.1 S-adenosyl-L-methionine-dependent methyltransferase [Basidiobolus meristosporus CBS 931.73]
MATKEKVFEELANQITQIAGKIEDLDLFHGAENDRPEKYIQSLDTWKAVHQLCCVLDHLQSSILPPTIRITQLAGSYMESRALFALCKYGVADALQQGPLHLNELAQRVNARPEMLERALRTGIRMGLFQETEVGSSTYANNRVSDFLCSLHPETQRGWVNFWAGDGFEITTKLQCTLDPEQQRTAFSEYFNTDDSIWAHYEKPENRHMVKVFSDAMIGLSELTNFGLVEASAPMQSLTTQFPGDFFESVCPGAQVYFLRWTIHNWSDSEATQILKSIRTAIPHNGTLLLADIVMSKDAKVNDRFANQLDLMMAELFWTKERKEEEFSHVLEAAGFQLRKVWKLRAALSVIEAIPQ